MTNTNSFLTAKSQHIVREGVQFNKPVTGTLIVTDLDGLINGDISVLGLPPGGKFEITSVLLEPLGKTAHVQWSYKHTDPSFSGWANALIKVVDDKGVLSAHHVQVEVPPYAPPPPPPPVNTPSWATGGDFGEGTIDSLLIGKLTVCDEQGIPDNPKFTFASQSGHGDFDIDPVTGTWSYSSSTVGQEVVYVKVTDAANWVSSVGITFTTTASAIPTNEPLPYVG